MSSCIFSSPKCRDGPIFHSWGDRLKKSCQPWVELNVVAVSPGNSPGLWPYREEAPVGIVTLLHFPALLEVISRPCGILIKPSMHLTTWLETVRNQPIFNTDRKLYVCQQCPAPHTIQNKVFRSWLNGGGGLRPVPGWGTFWSRLGPDTGLGGPMVQFGRRYQGIMWSLY